MCEVYKWKARLNIHGGKQEHGVNYWETYAATLSWPPICFLLTMLIINKWRTRQIDFTLAYPQADIECDLYMDIPRGFDVEGGRANYCLKLIKNIYGQKQAGRTWSQHLKRGLIKIGFVQSAVDECIFYRNNTLFLRYVDDGIFASTSDEEIDKCISDLRLSGFKLTDEGNLNEYLGI